MREAALAAVLLVVCVPLEARTRLLGRLDRGGIGPVDRDVVDGPVDAVDDIAVSKTDAPAIETTEETRARLERDADDK